jgi:hypothetical protein
VEATHAMVVLAIETSAQEVTVAWDGANLHIKDAEDWAALAEREALERVSRAEAENSTALSSARADAEGLKQKIVLLEDELAEERRVWQTPEREHRERFKELTLLQTRDSKLCLAIIVPPQERHLSVGIWLAALHHTEMVGELAAFWAAMSSATDLKLRRSPSNTTHAEVVGE